MIIIPSSSRLSFFLWFWLLLKVSLLIKHTICGSKHCKLSTAVQLIGYFLLLLIEFLDEIFSGEHRFPLAKGTSL